MANDVLPPTPLEMSRSNLYEIQSMLQAVCQVMGVPAEVAGPTKQAVEPITLQEKIGSVLTMTSEIRSSLVGLQDFISRI
jgi:hypothetical protein